MDLFLGISLGDAMDHATDRKLVEKAWELAFNRKPKLFEARTVHAVALLETDFGRGWKGAGVGSNNVAANQSPGCPEGRSFAYTDTHPNPDGTSTSYKVCFAKYPALFEGVQALVKVMVADRPEVQRAMTKGSELAVSAAMWVTVYYEGFGADEDDRIVNHYLALMRNAKRVSAALGEQLPVGAKLLIPADAGKPTLRFGSMGPLVAEWQRIIGVAADGIFGRVTERETRAWQAQEGLVADGVVGPRTWSKAALIMANM